MAKISYSHGRVVDSALLLIRDLEPAKLDVDFNDESLQLEILFKPTPNPVNKEQQLTWTTENGIVKFIFFEWNNALGSTTTEPVHYLGTKTDGSPIFFSLVHHKVGIIHQLFIQFILGNLGTTTQEAR